MSIVDQFKTQLVAEKEKAGVGIAAFEEMLGLKRSTINSIVSGRDARVPSIEKAERIADALGWEFYIGPPRRPIPPATIEMPASLSWDRFTASTLPRRGIARCGVQGWGKSQPLNDPLPSPEALEDPDAFYVIASGQSMIPEGIEGGMACLVSPAKKVQAGDRIWIRDKSGATAIKRLMKIEGDRLHLRGWMPRSDAQQHSFDEQRFLNYIVDFYPVVAVYRGLPGNDNVELVPDPKKPAEPEPDEDMVHIHLHDQQFAAGDGMQAEDSVMSSVAFPAPWLKRMGLTEQSAALVWVKDDSMEPTLKSDAMVMLDTRVQQPEKRRVYAFRYGEDLFIKRLEWIGDTLIAQSDNSEYDTMILSGPDLEQLQVFGEVVWSGHRVAS